MEGPAKDTKLYCRLTNTQDGQNHRYQSTTRMDRRDQGRQSLLAPGWAVVSRSGKGMVQKCSVLASGSAQTRAAVETSP